VKVGERIAILGALVGIPAGTWEHGDATRIMSRRAKVSDSFRHRDETGLILGYWFLDGQPGFLVLGSSFLDRHSGVLVSGSWTVSPVFGFWFLVLGQS
jgi:hypothetical protein